MKPIYVYPSVDNSSTTTGELQKVEVAQEKVGDEYKYSVSVNDKELINVVNNQTYTYKDVYIFAGAPWFKPDGRVIKKLTYFTKGTRFFEKCIGINCPYVDSSEKGGAFELALGITPRCLDLTNKYNMSSQH